MAKAGRPKGSTADNLGTLAARRHADKAMKVLVDIMNDGQAPTASRVTAAENILSRAYGKPSQTLEHTGANGGPIQMESMKRDAELFTSTIASLVARDAADESSGATQH